MIQEALLKKIEVVIKESQSLNIVPDTLISPPFITVYGEGFDDNPFSLRWEEISEPSFSENSILIHGALASRVLEILKFYEDGIVPYGKSEGDPECHGSAFYVNCIADHINKLTRVGQFKEIYAKCDVEFSYWAQKPPALVHLLHREIDISGIPEFAKGDCDHSLTFLGCLNGVEVCLEKRPGYEANFIDLKDSEMFYGTNYRLFVKPCFKGEKPKNLFISK